MKNFGRLILFNILAIEDEAICGYSEVKYLRWSSQILLTEEKIQHIGVFFHRQTLLENYTGQFYYFSGGAHNCAICDVHLENYGLSRPLTQSNCDLYGMKEENLKPDMRVCSSCRCKSVRRRYTQ